MTNKCRIRIMACIYSVALVGSLRSWTQEIPSTALSNHRRMEPLTTWRLIGPFQIGHTGETISYDSNTEEGAFSRDYLKLIGGSETPLSVPTPTTHLALSYNHNVDNVSRPFPGKPFVDQTVTFPHDVISSQQAYWGFPLNFGITYAVTNVISSGEHDITFIISGNSPIKIWLNNFVISTPEIGSAGHAWAGRYIVPVHLHPGNNFVLVKLFCFPKRNDFAFRLADNNQEITFISNNDTLQDLLDHVIVPRGANLPISANAFQAYKAVKANFYIDVIGARERILRERKLSTILKKGFPTRGLPDGLYDLHLRSIGHITRSETFFLGDVTKAVNAYEHTCEHTLSVRIGAPCDLVGPLKDSLLKHSNLRRLDFEKPVLLLLSQIVWGMRGDDASSAFQLHDRHLHLVTYRSRIDGSVQYYYVHIPPGYSQGKPLPLVVVCPFSSKGTQHTGPPVEVAFEFEKYVYFADKFDMLILMPFGKGLGLSSSVGMDDVLQTLEDVERTFRLDRSRIYLFGDCEGGRGALLLAEHQPSRFAAISTLNAATDSPLETHAADRLIENAYALKSTPILLIHGDFFPHSPTEQAYNFTKICNKVHVFPIIKIIGGDGKLSVEDPMNISMNFFKSKRLPKASQSR